MSLNGWLRKNAEHYLLVGAQKQVAAAYGHVARLPKPGLKGEFFLRLFVPIYRLIPWKLRLAILQRLPGSHRQTWNPRERRPLGPAV